MNCEICGKDSELYETLIEGTKLDVCTKCSSFGKVIAKKETSEEVEKPAARMQFPKERDIVVDDYAKLVKTAREKMKLTQEELARAIAEKESLIHQIESSHIMPQIKTAKKLEQYLRIKLITDHVEEETGIKLNFGDDGLTIGDLVKIKEKKTSP